MLHLQGLKASRRSSSRNDRVPTTSADGLNFDSDFDDDDMDEAETAHLEHKTAKNIKCTLRKWDQYIHEKYNGVHPDFEQIESKKVSQIVIIHV